MTYKTAKPVAIWASQTGLGILSSFPADDPRDNPIPAELQAFWLARRYGVSRHRAPLIAALAFGGAAR